MNQLRPFGQFLHPLGILALTVVLAATLGCWPMAPFLFGIELAYLRHHHQEFHRGSCFDHDAVYSAGVWIMLIGLGCMAWMAWDRPGWLSLLSVMFTIIFMLLVCLISDDVHAYVHAERHSVDRARSLKRCLVWMTMLVFAAVGSIGLGCFPGPDGLPQLFL